MVSSYQGEGGGGERLSHYYPTWFVEVKDEDAMLDYLATAKPYCYWAGVSIFLLLEEHYAYRPATVSRLRRWLTNIPLAVLNGSIYQLLYGATIVALLESTGPRQLGLLQHWPLPTWLRIAAGVIILDGSIYLWHLLTHQLPLLWRFHRIHHNDLNMDVTTASRFHLGEFLVSGGVRLLVIHAFGIPLTSYLLFELLTNLAIQFHHSSIKVNQTFQWYYHYLFVPPFLHRIHHSVVRRECDSNYGVLLSLWDRLGGTLRTEVDQDKIVIGVASDRDIAQLGLWPLLRLPLASGQK